MKNITSKVKRDDMENARLDRDRASNPANVEPGMDDFDWGEEDMFNSKDDSGGWGADSNIGPFGGGGGFGDNSGPFGGGSGGFGSPDPFGGFGGGFNSGFNQPQQEPPRDKAEDKFFETIGKVFKGFVSFSGEFVQSFKHFDVMKRMSMGKSVMLIGGLVALSGVILSLFGLGSSLGINFIIGGLASVGLGVPLFMFSYDSYTKHGAPEPAFTDSFEPAFDDSPEPYTPSSGWGDDDDYEEDEEFDMFADDDDEEDDYSDFSSDDSYDFSAFETPETDPAQVEKNMLTTLDNLNINNGMVTRQYLYENIVSCLMTINPTFDKIRNITDTSDEFDAWDAIVQSSAGVFKPKGNDIDLPYLISAKERLFYVQLEIKRVNWLKNIDSFVTEIVNICRFDSETGATDMRIFGIGNTVGDKIYVKIMKGETAMISVKDAYKDISSEITNAKNFMPIVLGLDAEGNVVWQDFKDINSILITGMPRSGKTWAVQSILSQMMFYLKPTELHVHILDPKDQISDFKSMQMPHIRKFVSDDASILAELRHIVRVEGPRRKKIIGDAGFVNIWDYKKRNPDVDMPLLYVVIDEVITLAERMEDNVKKEFQALLLELVSQLPALGIRIFMIPHVVKDNILKKSITDLIPCRISVRGDSDHIEKSIGAKNFKYKLFHQGDMAVRFNNDDPMFVHSAVLTNSNEGNQDLFDFLLKFWTKLEPDSLKGSYHQSLQLNNKLNSYNNEPKGNITFQQPKYENNETARHKITAQDQESLIRGIHDPEPTQTKDISDDEINLWGDDW